MTRFLSLRARIAGSLTDVLSGVVMMAFILTAMFWLVGITS